MIAPLVAMILCASPADARLHALFIGDRGHHRPEDRLHEVWGPLARDGIVLDWEENLEAVTPALLKDYDCVVMYANQRQHATEPATFSAALDDFIKSGGGFVALHCTSGCFMQSPAWLDLVGARFRSHGAEVFAQRVVDAEHPVTDGWQPFETWDETYVQDHAKADRRLLTVRDEPDGRPPEPWCWVRDYGKGRIFYTASGHDHRTWTHPGWLEHLERAIVWSVGDEAAARHAAFKPVEFTFEPHPWVPNYEGHTPPMPFQKASTPTQATEALIVPAGFRAELFASEPMIVNPIAMAWDERGRCWVIESPDYPNDIREGRAGTDRISILEDTDGDGTADAKRVFAEGLNIPTGLMKVTGGVIVAAPPDLLFLSDLDGDDRSDGREVLFTGFGEWDTHAGPSNLVWGPDNAVWGALGYSGFKRADGSTFGSGLWSWDRVAGEPVFLAQFTNNTWGLGVRSDGEVFGSTANGAPSFFAGLPKPTLSSSHPGHPGASPVHDSARIHAALDKLQQGDFLGHYTGAAGHAFATGNQVPPHWVDTMAFVAEPTAHLIGRLQVYPDGAGFRTRDCFNLVASTDEWFCPVQAEVGPDGAIWIADLAQFIILHNLPGNPERGLPKVEMGEGNAHVNPLRDYTHGRIFRLVREDNSAPRSLADASPAELVAALADPNQFWRTTARRLLVEGQYTEVVDALHSLARGTDTTGAAEAIRTLHGLGALDGEEGAQTLAAALRSEVATTRHTALDLLPPVGRSASLLLDSGTHNHPDATTRRHAYLAAARLPDAPAIGTALAARAASETQRDTWLSTALAAGAAAHADAFVVAASPLLPDENAPAPDVLSVGHFNDDSASSPAAWTPMTWQGAGQHSRSEQGREGTPCLTVQSSSGGDAAFIREVSVKPDTRYRLEGWIRTQDIINGGGGFGALLVTHPGARKSQAVTGTQDWTLVSIDFTTDPHQTAARLDLLLGGWGLSTGQAWFDDVRLLELGPANDIRSIVDLARNHMSGANAAATSGPRHVDLAGGDAAAGEAIFRTNAIVACARCHGVDGGATGEGPDLTHVGSRLASEKILDSILDPNAALADGYTSPRSTMPALAPFLSDQEIRDLVAFLASRR